jgi:hypothetical protein
MVKNYFLPCEVKLFKTGRKKGCVEGICSPQRSAAANKPIAQGY